MKTSCLKLTLVCVLVAGSITAALTAQAQNFYVTTPYYYSGTLGKVDSAGDTMYFAYDPAFFFQGGVKFDTNGNLFATDVSSKVIKINPKGYATLFTSGLSVPQGIAFDVAGNLYTANSGDGSISKISPAGVVSTFVTSGTLSSPVDLVFDSSSYLYTANLGDQTITKIDSSGTVVSNLVATGTFAYPYGLAFDGAGNLTVADYNGLPSGNGTIYKVNPAGVVTTFSSDPLLIYPRGLVFDGAGNLYVCNSYYYSYGILKIDPTGTTATNFANTYGANFIALAPPGINIPALTFTDVMEGNLVPYTPAGAMFKKIGHPARNNSGYIAFKTTLVNKVGGVVTSNNMAIYAGIPGAETLRVQKSNFAPDEDGTNTTAIFANFSDPVYNNVDEIAFLGVLKMGVGGVTSADDKGLWSSHGGLHQVAREGETAPDTGGATFAKFKTFALPDSGDVVFLGILNSGTGSPAVSSSNDTGIWAYDQTGHLRLIARTGDSVPISLATSKTIKKLNFLPIVALSYGQSRSFAVGGNLTYKADFTDASSAILHVNHP